MDQFRKICTRCNILKLICASQTFKMRSQLQMFVARKSFQPNACGHQDAAAELRRLVGEMRAEGDGHQRALEAARQQGRREAEDARREGFHQRKTGTEYLDHICTTLAPNEDIESDHR